MSSPLQHLQQVRLRIQQAEMAAGRLPGSVKLLAVSKNHDVEDIQQLLDVGQTAFGESYLQEALEKISALGNAAIEWHFIGPIQSNKTALIAQHFHWVHSLDRLKIAQRLSDQRDTGQPLNICIQVKISAEPSKSGIAPPELSGFAKAVASLPNLRLRGLMTIPAPETDPVKQGLAFRQLKQALDRLNTEGLHLDTLSMGMSNDLEAAIHEGATIVRVGTALFGPRAPKHKN